MSTLLMPPSHHVGLGIVLPSVSQHLNPFAMTKFGSIYSSTVPDDIAQKKSIGLIPFSPILAHFILDHAPIVPHLDLDAVVATQIASAPSSTVAADAKPAVSVSVAPATTKKAPAKKTRRLTWSDECGKGDLCDTILFYRWDEPWRCSNTPTPPVITRAVSPTSEGSDKKAGTLEFDASTLPTNDIQMSNALATNGVTLESVTLRHPIVFLTIRVLNIAYEKKVTVRVSSDNWATHRDVQADFLPSSVDPKADRFYASISVPGFQCEQLSFAICYTCDGQTYWDNNSGSNYTVKINKPAAETLSLLQSFADGMASGISPFVMSR